MGKEDWRLCVDWLIACQLIPPNHQLNSPNAQVIDLAQLIRDGVMLCQLLNRLVDKCLSSKDFSIRPQASRFLCMKNIRTFLQTCKNVFHIEQDNLFEPNDLFEVRDFGKVINTLSELSCTQEATNTGIQGFVTKSRCTDYHPLHTLASNQRPPENVYDFKDEFNEIYEDLCSQRRVSNIQESVPVTKRDYCIKEIVETEKNYLDVLRMIIDCFIKRLRQKITEEDCQTIFMGVENLYAIHTGFYSDLAKACSQSKSFTYRSVNQPTIADCFIKWKEKFLAYGQFCSNLPKVLAVLDKISQNPTIQNLISECQSEANNGRFRLRDLLSVPMQRVLKYHLLLKELIKNTDELHPDKKSLQRALDEMHDLSGYVNEVKRDNENLQWIDDIKRSIVDLDMPDGTHLKDYGRLRKDGELRMKRMSEKKDRNIMLFLFDKVMLVCKIRIRDKIIWGESYNYKDAFVLSNYCIEEENPAITKEKEKICFALVGKSNKEVTLFSSKTPDVKEAWVAEIRKAHLNVCPPFSISAQHEFVMNSYNSPTICDVCRKLLKGVFFQGYRCTKTGINVHKDCIEKAKDVSGPPLIPPKRDKSVPTTPVLNNNHPHLSSANSSFATKMRVRTISAYTGLPAPPNNQAALTFEAGEVFTVFNNIDEHWWTGKIGNRDGFFPKNFVVLLPTKNVKTSSCRFNPSNIPLHQQPPLPPLPTQGVFLQPKNNLTDLFRQNNCHLMNQSGLRQHLLLQHSKSQNFKPSPQQQQPLQHSASFFSPFQLHSKQNISNRPEQHHFLLDQLNKSPLKRHEDAIFSTDSLIDNNSNNLSKTNDKKIIDEKLQEMKLENEKNNEEICLNSSDPNNEPEESILAPPKPPLDLKSIGSITLFPSSSSPSLSNASSTNQDHLSALGLTMQQDMQQLSSVSTGIVNGVDAEKMLRKNSLPGSFIHTTKQHRVSSGKLINSQKPPYQQKYKFPITSVSSPPFRQSSLSSPPQLPPIPPSSHIRTSLSSPPNYFKRRHSTQIITNYNHRIKNTDTCGDDENIDKNSLSSVENSNNSPIKIISSKDNSNHDEGTIKCVNDENNNENIASFDHHDGMNSADKTDDDNVPKVNNDKTKNLINIDKFIISPRKNGNSEDVKICNLIDQNSIDEPWYAGEMSRTEANSLLEGSVDGSFLVRLSNMGARRGEHALSIKFGNFNSIKHIKLQKKSSGHFYIAENKLFKSIPELITYYQQNSLERSFPEVPGPLTVPYKHCRFSNEDADEDLNVAI